MDFFFSTGFYIKSKVIEVSHKGKNIFVLISGHFFSKCIIFVCDIFFSTSGYPIKYIFQWQYVFMKFMFLMKCFFS